MMARYTVMETVVMVRRQYGDGVDGGDGGDGGHGGDGVDGGDI